MSAFATLGLGRVFEEPSIYEQPVSHWLGDDVQSVEEKAPPPPSDLPVLFFNPALHTEDSVHGRCVEMMHWREYIVSIAISALGFYEILCRFSPLPVIANRTTLTDHHVDLLSEIGIQVDGDQMDIPGCGAKKKVSYVFSNRLVRKHKDPSQVMMTPMVILSALYRVYQPYRCTNRFERVAIAAVFFKSAVDSGLKYGELPLPVAIDAVLEKTLLPDIDIDRKTTGRMMIEIQRRATEIDPREISTSATKAATMLDGLNLANYIALPGTRLKDTLPRIIRSGPISVQGLDAVVSELLLKLESNSRPTKRRHTHRPW